jgi:hypothetical protein
MPPDTPLRTVFSGSFSFTARPEPVPGDLRMSWGIAILLLSLRSSRARKASWQKLQFLAHAVRMPRAREDVRALLRNALRPSEIAVRVEPWLNRAVAFAHAMKLVSVDKGKSVSLTAKGREVAEQISKGDELLVEERAFLEDVAPRMTEALLQRIWGMEDLL